MKETTNNNVTNPIDGCLLLVSLASGIYSPNSEYSECLSLVANETAVITHCTVYLLNTHHSDKLTIPQNGSSCLGKEQVR